METLPEALVGVHLLRWIATYPADKVIRSLNNWGQAGRDHGKIRINDLQALLWPLAYKK